ncbi:MAG: DUF5615 family PIN-like protein [Candidatus Aenigmarchaeota archaeon]|nr:DUF5615 family PIN-like protein [Candidatus Aenigmarchaeota archaeon]
MKRQDNWKPKFLIDQNISPKTLSFLKDLGFDAKGLADFGLGGKEDEEIFGVAEREGRTVITFDKDFGEIYYFSEGKKVSVIVLYLDDQTHENVNAILKKFLENTDLEPIKNKLVILYKDRIRLASK